MAMVYGLVTAAQEWLTDKVCLAFDNESLSGSCNKHLTQARSGAWSPPRGSASLIRWAMRLDLDIGQLCACVIATSLPCNCFQVRQYAPCCILLCGTRPCIDHRLTVHDAVCAAGCAGGRTCTAGPGSRPEGSRGGGRASAVGDPQPRNARRAGDLRPLEGALLRRAGGRAGEVDTYFSFTPSCLLLLKSSGSSCALEGGAPTRSWQPHA